MKTLSLGANGPEVCVLQTRLNSKPPTTSPLLSPDGVFGPKTLARVREFQKNASLTVDGVVGQKTWGSLLAPPSTSKPVSRFCDDGIVGNKSAAGTAAFAATSSSSAKTSPAAFSLASFSLPSLPSLPKLRSLSSSEIAIATGVYGLSIDFSTVFVSDKTGIGGRAFVLAVPNPLGKAIQIMNVGLAPSRDTLVHELGHVWQSQHHSSSTQYMVNAIASQALEEAANLVPGSSKSFSAYGYRPGKPFAEYAAEQVAQQAMRGEAPIIAHMKAVGPGAVDPDNVTGLKKPQIEDTSLPGVKT
jgi:putative peptidoglycan binding protein